MAGATKSPGWVSGGWNTTYNAGGNGYDTGHSDAFAVRFSPSGAHLWSTYLGEAGQDVGRGIAEAPGGDVIVAGETESCGWVEGGGNLLHAGGSDGFLARFSPAGAHRWSTYLDGTAAYRLAVDGEGGIYILGHALPFRLAGGGWSAPDDFTGEEIVTRLSASGDTLWSSRLLTGTACDIAAGADGAVYLAGYTFAAGWLDGGWDDSYNGNGDGFVASVRHTDGTGDLRVAVEPPEASGTLWRIAGRNGWRSIGETASDLEAGEWSVEFRDMFGFAPPGRRSVTVPDGETAMLTAECVPVPVDIQWGTYLGGSSLHDQHGLVVDGAGNVYMTGIITSGWCGMAEGGWDVTANGGEDAYVVKLSPAGAHLWSTYLGGDTGDYGVDVAVDGAGNVYAMGFTESWNWVSGGWDTESSSRPAGYLAKLSPGGGHVWSTYLDGVGAVGISGVWNHTFVPCGIAADMGGNVYFAGGVWQVDWVNGGWDTTPNGNMDAVLVKFSPSGAHLWSTYLGGASLDWGGGVAAGADGFIYVAGYTKSEGWVSGGWNTLYSAPNGHGFLARFSPDGGHAWSTYLGGSVGGIVTGVCGDSSGNAFVTGITGSGEWVEGGGDTSFKGLWDGYAAKFSPEGQPEWSTLFGGEGVDEGVAVAADASGRVFAVGTTRSTGWVTGGWDADGLDGEDNTFVLQLSPSGVKDWASFLRGTATDVAASVEGAVLVAGVTDTPGWLYGGWEETLKDTACAYVARIVENPLPMPPANPGAVVGTDWITWTWEDTVSAETGFRVWSDPGVSEPETLRTTTAPDVFSWTQTGLSPNTVHTFQVAAVNASGDSVRTSPVTVWTLAGTPAAPALSRPMGTTLDLAVGAGDGNPVNTEYALRCVTTGEWVQADGSLGAAPVWQPAGNWGTVRVTGLAGLTEYSFDVTARNGAGVETAPGPSASATTLEATPPTGTVTINGGAAVTSSPLVTLSLTYADGAGSGVAEMRFSHDGLVWTDWEAAAATRAWTLTPGDAPKTVYVQYRDAAENVSVGPISDGILFDAENPSAVVALADPTPTQATALRYAVTFSEAVSPTFDASDVSLTGALSGTVAVTGTDPAYTVTVTLTGVTPDGLTGIQLGTNVQDVLGKPFAGAVSPDYDVVWWPGFASANPPVRGYVGDAGPVLDAALRPGGARTPSWQWYWDRGTDGLPDLGPAAAQWDLGLLSSMKTGEYWCLVSYGGLVFETDHAGLDVADRVTITQHPQDQEVSPGRSATFTTAATGGFPPLHYQWKHDGANASDSPDLPVFMLLNMSAEDAGEYTVEVSDSHADTAVSEPATLTLGPPLPVVGLAGLAALAAVLVLAGRRRK